MQIKILDIVPIIHTDDFKAGLEIRQKLSAEITDRLKGLIKLDTDFIDYGVASIENAYDEAVNTMYILQKAKNAQEKGYDAVVIDCMGDPGLDACREVVEIPVLGAAETSYHLATQIAPAFSIITVLPEFNPIAKNLAIKYGVTQHLASVRTASIPVLELEKDFERNVSVLTEVAKKTMKEDGAYAVVLGCTGMATLADAVKEKLKAEGLDVPLIEPLRATVYSAINWCLIGISHSKAAYPEPRRKTTSFP